jgi:protein-L-isoaspartate O-methyltransferase
MASSPVRGTEGYAEEAADLVRRFETFSFADVHRPVLHLIPNSSGSAVDIGAGTGRDGAYLAQMGYRVVAVEPNDGLRIPGMALHPSPLIEWIDVSLPDLSVVLGRHKTFDLVMLTAVWMHLDEQQRHDAMPNVASLLRSGGMMILSIRHGPVSPGRRAFDVSADETIELARAQRLVPVFNLRTGLAPDESSRDGSRGIHAPGRRPQPSLFAPKVRCCHAHPRLDDSCRRRRSPSTGRGKEDHGNDDYQWERILRSL